MNKRRKRVENVGFPYAEAHIKNMEDTSRMKARQGKLTPVLTDPCLQFGGGRLGGSLRVNRTEAYPSAQIRV